MKLAKILSIFLVCLFIMSFMTITSSALQIDCDIDLDPQVLRAGGGSGGGSDGGSGGSGGNSGSGGTSTRYYRGGRSSFLSNILWFITVPFILFGAAIIFRFKLFKYSKNTKKLMSMLEKKDSAWKYKKIQKQVHDAYFLIQKSWSNMDMTPAKRVMSEDLYESFQTKLNWMSFKNQKNVLQKIKLIEAVPVSLYDDENNTYDHVWFYITGSMVDYIIDTTTNMKINGKTSSKKFSEYWQFTRKDNGIWVLNKILQKDEAYQIAFSE